MGLSLRGVVSGGHSRKQMRVPLVLGLGLTACLALYVLFSESDPVGAGRRWSRFSGGGDVGNRKTGTVAATGNDTSVSIGPPRGPELEGPIVTNETKKRDDIQDLLPPPSPVPSNLPPEEPKQVSPSPPPTTTTKKDDTQVVSVSPSSSPPPPLTTSVPLNASSDPITPPGPIATDTPAAADVSQAPVTPQNPFPAADMSVPTNASPDLTIPPNPVTSADKPFSPPTTTHDVDLLRVLRRASMGNNTVIITTLNEAWAVPNSVVDLFFESFRIGIGTQDLLQHLVIVAVDPRGYERCKAIHPHCYLMVTEGKDFSKEELFMTPDYMDMMWRRLQFLGSIVELGFSFVFTDTDIMWLRNPFLRFDPSADLSIACDHYAGDPDSLYNGINGGFYYVQSNPRTIEFYKYWYRSRWQHPKDNEQDVFNMIKADDFTNKLGIKIKYLDTMYFSGFCEITKYFGEVITMHANCCIGLQRKVDDLRLVLEDWGNYTKLSWEERRNRDIAWRVPKSCR